MTMQRKLVFALLGDRARYNRRLPRWPARRAIRSAPITVIVPFAGGSASDVVTRILFERVERSRSGSPSSSTTARAPAATPAPAAAKATPDGYTLVGSGSGSGRRQHRRSTKTSATIREKDFEPIALFAVFPSSSWRSTKLPVKTLARADRLCQGSARTSSTTARSASAARSTWPARISSRSPALSSPTCPIATSRNTTPDLIVGHGAARLPVASERAARRCSSGGAKALAVASDKRMAALPERPDHRRGRRARTT